MTKRAAHKTDHARSSERKRPSYCAHPVLLLAVISLQEIHQVPASKLAGPVEFFGIKPLWPSRTELSLPQPLLPPRLAAKIWDVVDAHAVLVPDNSLGDIRQVSIVVVLYQEQRRREAMTHSFILLIKYVFHDVTERPLELSRHYDPIPISAGDLDLAVYDDSFHGVESPSIAHAREVATNQFAVIISLEDLYRNNGNQ